MHPAASPPSPRESDATPRIVGAIPARYGSTRLPGKALLDIDGRPMIEHVYRKAQQVKGLHRVVVLTDDERIASTVEEFGGEFEMTPTDCQSGTDRIAAALRSWGERESSVDAVVNIQGDEPLVEPSAIERLARHLASHPEDEMATLSAPLDPGRLDDPNAVKVVTDLEGYAMYFSRAGIPYPRDPEAHRPSLHIGVYGYRTGTVLRLADLPPSGLERAESLEQLRALEHGVRIRVLATEHAWRGIDTIEDLEEIRRWFAEERPVTQAAEGAPESPTGSSSATEATAGSTAAPTQERQRPTAASRGDQR